METTTMPDGAGTLPIGVIYTGGTIGMTPTERGLAVNTDAADFEGRLRAAIGQDSLNALTEFRLVKGLSRLIDSSNADPSDWLTLASLVFRNRHLYSGFVLLTGTDTMAWTASALGMMLAGLNIPVVLTGSQLALGQAHGDRTSIDRCTDAVTNVEAALRFCVAIGSEHSTLRSAVFLCFDRLLLRGSCARKVHSSSRRAFESPNLAPLGHLHKGSIELERSQIFDLTAAPEATRRDTQEADQRKIATRLDALLQISDWNAPAVASCFILPGMSGKQLEAAAWPGCRALLLISFGAGNVPALPAGTSECGFSLALAAIRRRNILILNTSQCTGGGVSNGYAASASLRELGVVQGGLMTPEAAHVKLHLIAKLPQYYPYECLDQDIAGETATVF